MWIKKPQTTPIEITLKVIIFLQNKNRRLRNENTKSQLSLKT